MYAQYIDTPIGRLYARADGNGITHLSIAPAVGVDYPPPGEGDFPWPLAQQLGEYFAGERREFDLPLAPGGSEFDRRVYDQLTRIPYGQTITYGELARRVGNPRAARAVGGANGRNPVLLVIPCHRVVAANGPGGYSAGMWRKRLLLALEGAPGEWEHEDGGQ